MATWRDEAKRRGLTLSELIRRAVENEVSEPAEPVVARAEVWPSFAPVAPTAIVDVEAPHVLDVLPASLRDLVDSGQVSLGKKSFKPDPRS